jgi:hypothetical protein
MLDIPPLSSHDPRLTDFGPGALSRIAVIRCGENAFGWSIIVTHRAGAMRSNPCWHWTATGRLTYMQKLDDEFDQEME